MSEISLKLKLELAKKLVREAGDFLLAHLTDTVEITEKSRFDDLVTNLDKAVQMQVIAGIRAAYPDDYFLAEEDADSDNSSDVKHDILDGNVWVLDPIDGTTNFIVQRDDFAVMLAYYENGIGKIGVILDVIRGNLYWGDGQKSYKNDRQISLVQKPLRESLLGVNTYMYRTNVGGLLDLSFDTLGVRAVGSAGIDYVHILDGKIWGYFSNLSPWDYAAGSVLLAPFDFVTVQLDGSPLDFKGRQMMMSVPKNQLAIIADYQAKSNEKKK
ncbi:inositol monophosphatase family protein [Pseudolactococcus insecticola]|uniref:Inositol monophosphatase n=1 Tax=Pseudolactococcus insecticola TaxID=2709158 RepID=A0A6A0B543_9LACT|nr:inositol monophosphatase family protein [Lactococcus insecticola]GFH40519.1 hypothetical protein Hs20B_09170 [Lactococcus insecticola]